MAGAASVDTAVMRGGSRTSRDVDRKPKIAARAGVGVVPKSASGGGRQKWPGSGHVAGPFVSL